MEIAIFVFNPFSENTYILSDPGGECIIVDPGCNNHDEETRLSDFIRESKLTPVRLINTHFHIDHVLGNKFIYERYGLIPEFHSSGMELYHLQGHVASNYGIRYEPGPAPEKFLEDGDEVHFGTTRMQVIHVPGHSRCGICLYHPESRQLIAGDVLFKESIGRTDLPGGDYNTLINGIRKKLFILEDDTVVYPGHGPSTSIGYEKERNPFLR